VRYSSTDSAVEQIIHATQILLPRCMRYAGMAAEKLGLAVAADNSNNIELNLVVDSSRDRDDLKDWFDEVEGRKPDQKRQR
jgi:acetolactate synthase regulatory subunit